MKKILLSFLLATSFLATTQSAFAGGDKSRLENVRDVSHTVGKKVKEIGMKIYPTNTIALLRAIAGFNPYPGTGHASDWASSYEDREYIYTRTEKPVAETSKASDEIRSKSNASSTAGL